ncbi:MAG: glycosyltransferase [Chloroflexia bacterium]|nr:glycosyltransferase [Chloroflexia bacterium]
MRVALVHDYLNQYGGAERVLEALHELYPESPVYTSLYDPRRMPPSWRDWDIRASWLRCLPGARRFSRFYLPFYPLAFEAFDLRGFELVLSSSSAFAKGVIPADGALHVCYCHNPSRFLWNTAGYLAYERLGRWIAPLLQPLLHRLRIWDVSSSARVDAFIANSINVAGRIRRYYRRESRVIHPPVPVSSFPLARGPGRYFLAGGRLIPYKRIDLAVIACSELDLPLRIYGQGRDLPRLQRLAGPSVQFLGPVSEQRLRQLYQECRAFIFPGEEDLGLTAVEAMACGRPVLAYAAGGALETVAEGLSGLFFRQQQPQDLIALLDSFRDESFDPQQIRAHAMRFDHDRFLQQVRQFIQEQWERQL